MKTALAYLVAALAIGGVTFYAMTVLLSIQGFELSIHGKIAMALGVIFTMGVGFGLMALVFHSNKQGHDEAVYHLTDDTDDATPGA